MKLNSFKKKNKAKLPIEQVQKKGSLNIIADDHNLRYKYDENWENRTFLDTVKIANVKGILTNVPNAPLALANGFGYMQILSIEGKDLYAASYSEQFEIVSGYKQWLDAMEFDFTELTTRLPTDLMFQIAELRELHEEVIQILLSPNMDERKRAQKEYRRDVLEHQIKILEIVARDHFNTEFFVMIHGRTLEELNFKVQTSNNASRAFRPRIVSVEKKEQIVRNLNNPNGNGE
jgi:hypothetical protein